MSDNEDQCEVCKIFSNPNRLSILVFLRCGPKTVTEIVESTKISQSAVSQHLSMMKIRGIVKTKRKGTYIQYSLAYPEIMDAYDIMKRVTKKIGK